VAAVGAVVVDEEQGQEVEEEVEEEEEEEERTKISKEPLPKAAEVLEAPVNLGVEVHGPILAHLPCLLLAKRPLRNLRLLNSLPNPLNRLRPRLLPLLLLLRTFWYRRFLCS
jgi:hypothetical protein